MKPIVGIDPGGTKCEAVLMRPDGVVLGWGRCDADDPECKGQGGRSVAAVYTALRRALRGSSMTALRIVHSAGGWVPLSRILPPEYSRTIRHVSVSGA